jgi:hypothetical protein
MSWKEYKDEMYRTKDIFVYECIKYYSMCVEETGIQDAVEAEIAQIAHDSETVEEFEQEWIYYLDLWLEDKFGHLEELIEAYWGPDVI